MNLPSSKQILRKGPDLMNLLFRIPQHFIWSDTSYSEDLPGLYKLIHIILSDATPLLDFHRPVSYSLMLFCNEMNQFRQTAGYEFPLTEKYPI